MQRTSCRQDVLIRPYITLLRARITETAVAVLKFVQTHELSGPGTSIFQLLKPLRRELRSVHRPVRKSDSANALLSLTGGNEYEGSMPSQLRMASTVATFRVGPLSPCSAGLVSIAAIPLGQRGAPYQIYAIHRLVAVVHLGTTILRSIGATATLTRGDCQLSLGCFHI
jgi:hypothetical protein